MKRGKSKNDGKPAYPTQAYPTQAYPTQPYPTQQQQMMGAGSVHPPANQSYPMYGQQPQPGQVPSSNQSYPMVGQQTLSGQVPPSNQAYPMVGQQPPPSQVLPSNQTYPMAGQPPVGPPPPYQAAPGPANPQVYPQHPQAVAMQPQMMMYTPPPSNHGNFDPSARFGKGASYNIPPPPPGVMPTGAQVAAMQGQAVHMTHQKKGWFEGASDGGATLW